MYAVDEIFGLALCLLPTPTSTEESPGTPKTAATTTKQLTEEVLMFKRN